MRIKATIIRNTIDLTLNITVPREPNISPGIYPYEVKIKSLSDETFFKILYAQLNVTIFHEVEITLLPLRQQTEPNSTVIFAIKIQNKGNVDDLYNISIENYDFGSAFRSSPTKLKDEWVQLDIDYILLNPNEIGYAYLAIFIPYNWASMENITYLFNITSTCSEDLSVSGSIIGELCVIASPETMLRYILYELSLLKIEISQRIDDCCKKILLGYLEKVECSLLRSLEFLICKYIYKSVLLDRLAKIYLERTDKLNVIMSRHKSIPTLDRIYISTSLRTIRDDLTITMGETIGLLRAHKIAELIIKIDQLNDEIFENYSNCHLRKINNFLYYANHHLDIALLKLVIGCENSLEIHLKITLCKLERTKSMIEHFKNIEIITEEEALYLIDRVNEIIQALGKI